MCTIHANSSRQKTSRLHNAAQSARYIYRLRLASNALPLPQHFSTNKRNMSPHSNINSVNQNANGRPTRPSADQQATGQHRSHANISAISNDREDVNSTLKDRDKRALARSALQAQSFNVATTANARRPTEAAVPNANLQSSSEVLANAARDQTADDRRVIRERVARNNGRTHDEIEAVSIILEMAQRAEATEAELAQRRGWRRA